MGSARNSSDSTQYIGCYFEGYTSGSQYILCFANNSSGTYGSCTSSDPRLMALGPKPSPPDSLLEFSWNSSGACTFLEVANVSYLSTQAALTLRQGCAHDCWRRSRSGRPFRGGWLARAQVSKNEATRAPAPESKSTGAPASALAAVAGAWSACPPRAFLDGVEREALVKEITESVRAVLEERGTPNSAQAEARSQAPSTAGGTRPMWLRPGKKPTRPDRASHRGGERGRSTIGTHFCRCAFDWPTPIWAKSCAS